MTARKEKIKGAEKAVGQVSQQTLREYVLLARSFNMHCPLLTHTTTLKYYIHFTAEICPWSHSNQVVKVILDLKLNCNKAHSLPTRASECT